MERRNAWTGYDERQIREMEKIASLFKNCLDNGKTERERDKGRKRDI